jgi:phage terminase small subunit
MSDITPQPTPPLTPQERFEARLAMLKGQRRRFAMEYLVDLRQRDAAIRAGYSEKSADQQASVLMKNPEVFAAIQAGLDALAMPASEILARLSAQARGDMSDFVRIDEEEVTLTWSVLRQPPGPDGEPDMEGAVFNLATQEQVKPTDLVLRTATVRRPAVRLDLQEAGRRGKLGLLKKCTVAQDGKVSIELYDAQAALIALGKHRNLFVERKEVTGAGGAPVEHVHLTLDEWKRQAAERRQAAEQTLALFADDGEAADGQ